MTETFNNWTEYDAWLIQNYEQYAMTNLNEIDGKVVVEYVTKEELDKRLNDIINRFKNNQPKKQEGVKNG